MSNIKPATPNDFKPIAAKFMDLCPQEVFKTECSFAAQLINKNPLLQKTTMQSRLEAVLNVAQTNLTLNPVLSFAHLVPRYNSKTKQHDCTLMPDYRGLINLAQQSGIKKVFAHNVYDGDQFAVKQGTSPSIEHNPMYVDGADLTHSYAVAVFEDGEIQFEVMTASELNDIRERSESWKAYKKEKIPAALCVWCKDYGEMCRKTVIKRLCKFLPKDRVKFEKLGKAIEIDNAEYIPMIDDIKIIELRELEKCVRPDQLYHTKYKDRTTLSQLIARLGSSDDWEEYRELRSELVRLCDDNQPGFREGTAHNKTVTGTQKAVQEHIDFDDAKEEMKK